jgi:hypothetical protein
MPKTTCTYTFIRHGFGCHNARNSLGARDHVPSYIDPELSELGKSVAESNGCLFKLDPGTLLFASPAIRCIETSYFMFKNHDKPVVVAPYLREIDEHSWTNGLGKTSKHSLKVLETQPSYMLRPISEQRKYLFNSAGIPENAVDFSIVDHDPTGRKAPGDIPEFIHWCIPKYGLFDAWIVTHAGVLRSYTNKGFEPGTGIVLKIEKTSKTSVKVVSAKSLKLPDGYLVPSALPVTDHRYFCPSNRCAKLCGTPKKILSKCIID